MRALLMTLGALVTLLVAYAVYAGSCPPGYSQSGNRCIRTSCPAGYQMEGGRCVKYSCRPGCTYVGGGKCRCPRRW